MKTYVHMLEGLMVKSPTGWLKYISGKAAYIVKGGIQRTGDPIEKKIVLIPTAICNAKFASESQEMTDMLAWGQDYVDNFDDLELEREEKLSPAYRWKLESLIENGVDLNNAVQRKIWQKRPDLLSDAEKDALIDEWEASQ